MANTKTALQITAQNLQKYNELIEGSTQYQMRVNILDRLDALTTSISDNRNQRIAAVTAGDAVGAVDLDKAYNEMQAEQKELEAMLQATPDRDYLPPEQLGAFVDGYRNEMHALEVTTVRQLVTALKNALTAIKALSDIDDAAIAFEAETANLQKQQICYQVFGGLAIQRLADSMTALIDDAEKLG